jgi:hypothetical protein
MIINHNSQWRLFIHNMNIIFGIEDTDDICTWDINDNYAKCPFCGHVNEMGLTCGAGGKDNDNYIWFWCIEKCGGVAVLDVKQEKLNDLSEYEIECDDKISDIFKDYEENMKYYEMPLIKINKVCDGELQKFTTDAVVPVQTVLKFVHDKYELFGDIREYKNVSKREQLLSQDFDESFKLALPIDSFNLENPKIPHPENPYLEYAGCTIWVELDNGDVAYLDGD